MKKRPLSPATWYRPVLTAIVVIFSVLIHGLASAEEPVPNNFRVDNGLFKTDQTEPFARTVTVFFDGMVYDFMLESDQITIFNEIEASFTLIDVSEGTKTVIPLQFIDKAIERIVARNASKSDPETQFLYNPKFDPIQKDTTTGELIFTSRWLTYRVDARQGDVKAAKQYRHFADACAKLNTVLRPGSKPPFARLLVNQMLADGTMLPKSILMTEGAEINPEAPRFRSEHRYEMKLNEADKKRIEDVKKSLETLKEKKLEEFQAL